MYTLSANQRELFRRALKAAKNDGERRRIAQARTWLGRARDTGDQLVVMLHLMLGERGPR